MDNVFRYIYRVVPLLHVCELRELRCVCRCSRNWLWVVDDLLGIKEVLRGLWDDSRLTIAAVRYARAAGLKVDDLQALSAFAGGELADVREGLAISGLGFIRRRNSHALCEWLTAASGFHASTMPTTTISFVARFARTGSSLSRGGSPAPSASPPPTREQATIGRFKMLVLTSTLPWRSGCSKPSNSHSEILFELCAVHTSS
jgi:hypothetical protein